MGREKQAKMSFMRKLARDKTANTLVISAAALVPIMAMVGGGVDAAQGAVRDGREWERDSDLVYTFQDGSLKGLNIRMRNVTFRSGDGLKTDINENRLIVGYTLPLW